MAERTAEHVGMAGNVLLCEHCGARQELTLPQPMQSVAALMTAWSKAHAKCQQIPGRSAFRYATALHDWLASDDTGVSSKTIYRHMLGYPALYPGYPLDPSDFGRCYRLLTLIPAWRERMHEMAAFGPEWTRLAAAWDELTALYEAEVDVTVRPHRAKQKNGGAPRLYDRMKEAIAGRVSTPEAERPATPEAPDETADFRTLLGGRPRTQ